MSKLPVTMKAASNAKAMHHAMPSALEGRSADGQDVLFKLEVAETLSIFRTFALKDSNVYRHMRICNNFMRKIVKDVNRRANETHFILSTVGVHIILLLKTL